MEENGAFCVSGHKSKNHVPYTFTDEVSVPIFYDEIYYGHSVF